MINRFFKLLLRKPFFLQQSKILEFIYIINHCRKWKLNKEIQLVRAKLSVCILIRTHCAFDYSLPFKSTYMKTGKCPAALKQLTIYYRNRTLIDRKTNLR